jgi:hypothetical protein
MLKRIVNVAKTFQKAKSSRKSTALDSIQKKFFDLYSKLMLKERLSVARALSNEI